MTPSQMTSGTISPRSSNALTRVSLYASGHESRRAVALEQVGDAIRRDRPREEVALAVRAAELAQPILLHRVLDPLGDGVELEDRAQIDDRLRQRRLLRPVRGD